MTKHLSWLPPVSEMSSYFRPRRFSFSSITGFLPCLVRIGPCCFTFCGETAAVELFPPGTVTRGCLTPPKPPRGWFYPIFGAAHLRGLIRGRRSGRGRRDGFHHGRGSDHHGFLFRLLGRFVAFPRLFAFRPGGQTHILQHLRHQNPLQTPKHRQLSRAKPILG